MRRQERSETEASDFPFCLFSISTCRRLLEASSASQGLRPRDRAVQSSFSEEKMETARLFSANKVNGRIQGEQVRIGAEASDLSNANSSNKRAVTEFFAGMDV